MTLNSVRSFIPDKHSVRRIITLRDKQAGPLHESFVSFSSCPPAQNMVVAHIRIAGGVMIEHRGSCSGGKPPEPPANHQFETAHSIHKKTWVCVKIGGPQYGCFLLASPVENIFQNSYQVQTTTTKLAVWFLFGFPLGWDNPKRGALSPTNIVFQAPIWVAQKRRRPSRMFVSARSSLMRAPHSTPENSDIQILPEGAGGKFWFEF